MIFLTKLANLINLLWNNSVPKFYLREKNQNLNCIFSRFFFFFLDAVCELGEIQL